MVKRNSSIKALLVGILGVLLTSGAFIQPASALSFDAHADAKDRLNNPQKYSYTQSGDDVNKSSLVTQVDGGFVDTHGTYHKNGIVSSLDANKLREGWNTLNGDADKVVYCKNGTLVSGWYKDGGGNWYYFDPATHFMVINQAKVIDGKEYYFDEDGEMLTNCNVGNSYYGVSGAKEGSARTDVNVGNYNTTLLGDYSLPEYNSLVAQGKIKAKLAWSTGSTYGDDTISANLVFYKVQ